MDKNHKNYDDEDDWGRATVELTKEQIEALNKDTKGLSNILRLIQISIILIFVFAFVGYVKGHNLKLEFKDFITSYNQNTYSDDFALDLLELDFTFTEEKLVSIYPFWPNLNIESKQEFIAQAKNFHERRLKISSMFLHSKLEIASALTFALSAFIGVLSLIFPLSIYNYMARMKRQNNSPFLTMYDLIRAEVIKYGLMIILLGSGFKLTTLNDPAIISAFVILLCLEQMQRISSMFK